MFSPLRLALLAALSVALSVPDARAETYGAYGHLQHRYERLSDFALDRTGVEHEQPYRHTLRARVGGKLAFSRDFWITSTVQLMDGQLLGAESPIPSGARSEGWRNGDLADRVLLRESTLQVPFGLGTLRVGRMPARWGMGLVMHDGETSDSPFDDARGGDIVNGIAVTLTPMLLFGPSRMAYAAHVSLGGDIVEEDELTRRIDGDLAWRVWGSVTWEETWLTGGVYVAMRNLERENLDQRQETLLDSAWRYQHPLSEDHTLSVEGEVALITGTRSELRPNGGGREERDIMQVGAAARVGLEDRALDTEYALELGYASGDSAPDDEVDSAFRFDPARRVGMILFDEVLSRMSARAYALRQESAEPDLRGDLGPTNGALTNALYLAPMIGWTLHDGTFDLDAGGVIAMAPSPLEGELLANDQAHEGGSFELLGYELNTSARVVVDIGELLTLSVGTQYGLFVSASRLDSLIGEQSLGVIHKWRLLADVSW